MKNVQFCISISMALASIFGTFIFVNIHRHDEMFIPGVNPKDVYRVFANFTNFFILEPNLIRFKLRAILDGDKIIDMSKEIEYNEFIVPDRKVELENNQDLKEKWQSRQKTYQAEREELANELPV